MTYYIYHIPGKKIGVTRDLEERVTNQQGYTEDEYEVLETSDNINHISKREHELQRKYGYRVDRQLYKDLHNNNYKQLNEMKINVTEMTTTFPCPVNKLKGRLTDELGMQWETEFGPCSITFNSIAWIMDNIKVSQYTGERCYIYNKAFARWFDNNDAHVKTHTLDNAKQTVDQYNGQCRTGALSPTGIRQEEKCPDCDCNRDSVHDEITQFDLIRMWAEDRGLYANGDPKTQALKLVEEVGETCRAILKEDRAEAIDGIGDCVVVLTNLAELMDISIEECIEAAYDEIKDRTGKMENGTYKKD